MYHKTKSVFNQKKFLGKLEKMSTFSRGLRINKENNENLKKLQKVPCRLAGEYEGKSRKGEYSLLKDR